MLFTCSDSIYWVNFHTMSNIFFIKLQNQSIHQSSGIQARFLMLLRQLLSHVLIEKLHLNCSTITSSKAIHRNANLKIICCHFSEAPKAPLWSQSQQLYWIKWSVPISPLSIFRTCTTSFLEIISSANAVQEHLPSASWLLAKHCKNQRK